MGGGEISIPPIFGGGGGNDGSDPVPSPVPLSNCEILRQAFPQVNFAEDCCQDPRIKCDNPYFPDKIKTM
jgi:hypothetical protein